MGKAGNSNTEERIALTRRFLKLVDPGDIRALVADREFIGEEWLGYLKSENAPFFIRIRKDTNVSAFGRLPRRGERQLVRACRIFTQSVYPYL